MLCKSVPKTKRNQRLCRIRPSDCWHTPIHIKFSHKGTNIRSAIPFRRRNIFLAAALYNILLYFLSPESREPCLILVCFAVAAALSFTDSATQTRKMYLCHMWRCVPKTEKLPKKWQKETKEIWMESPSICSHLSTTHHFIFVEMSKIFERIVRRPTIVRSILFATSTVLYLTMCEQTKKCLFPACSQRRFISVYGFLYKLYIVIANTSERISTNKMFVITCTGKPALERHGRTNNFWFVRA